MFEGSYFTKEQLKEMQEKSEKKRMENSERINIAFQAMMIQVFSTAISVLLLIMMICTYFSEPEVKKNFYFISILFWSFSLISVYSGMVKRKNSS